MKALLDMDILICDECHHGSSPTFYNFCLSAKARRVYGMSGTPESGKEIEEARLEGVCGPVVHRVAQAGLVDSGALKAVRVAVVMSDKASGPALPQVLGGVPGLLGLPVQRLREQTYAEAYVNGVAQNGRTTAPWWPQRAGWCGAAQAAGDFPAQGAFRPAGGAAG